MNAAPIFEILAAMGAFGLVVMALSHRAHVRDLRAESAFWYGMYRRTDAALAEVVGAKEAP